MSERRRRSGTRERTEVGRPRFWGMGPLNAALLLGAVIAIVWGYVLLDRGSVTAAPFLLVLGYVVLMPAGLLLGRRSESTDAGAAPGRD